MKLERRSKLTQSEFIERYLSPGRPVIVEDAIAQWPGSAKLLSERFFIETFASYDVQVYDDLFELLSIYSLQQYVDRYWHAAARSPVPYVRWYSKFRDLEFQWADDAFALLEGLWNMPYFLPSSSYELPRCHPPKIIDVARDGFPARGIFISAAGARTRLHSDPWCSDAILCQLSGRKKVVMYSPAAAPDLCRDGTVIDVDNPDRQSFPGFASRPPDIEDFLNQGETLYIPAGWFHHVLTVANSISLTWNFVHTVHAERFSRYRNGPLTPLDLEVMRYFGVV
ncbi:MAG: cupin-like domain-containing protein [Xanthobacteraceae bacterium]